MRPVEARYENGLLKPAKALPLRAGETVNLIVVRKPDASRWDLARLGRSGSADEVALTEAGLADWAEALDGEDRR